MTKIKARTILKIMVRDHKKKIIQQLTNRFQDKSLSQDAFQESVLKALIHWDIQIPENPQGWLYQTAKNYMLDTIRKHKVYNNSLTLKLHYNQLIETDSCHNEDAFISNEELKLIFTCCHPALSFDNQVALTLQVICGLSTQQIAQTFIKSKKTIEQRLVRAKKKIRLAKIPYQEPEKSQIKERTNAVLKVIYLVFNQGYYSGSNYQLIQNQLINQAIRLGRLMCNLIPDHAESFGLLSLMYFHKSRIASRVNNDILIDLETQNRKNWDLSDINQANLLFQKAIQLKSLGPFQIQAAISGVHTQAQSFKETDWHQIRLLYQKLLHYQNDEITQINYAISIAYSGDKNTALDILSHLEKNKKIANYLPFHLALGHILSKQKKYAKAIHSLMKAMKLSENSLEIKYLKEKIDTTKKQIEITN